MKIGRLHFFIPLAPPTFFAFSHDTILLLLLVINLFAHFCFVIDVMIFFIENTDEMIINPITMEVLSCETSITPG